MWAPWVLVLSLALHIAAIKVPIQPEEPLSTEVIPISRQKYTKDAPKNPIFISDKDQTTTDSYQVQPEEQTEASTNTESEQEHEIKVPARFLLPPRLDAETYSYPIETQTESDWTPITQGLPKVASAPPFVHKFAIPKEDEEETNIKDSYGETISLTHEQDLPKEAYGQWFNAKLIENPEGTNEEAAESDSDIAVPILIPSRELQPPLPGSPSTFDTSGPATELQPPLFKPYKAFRTNSKKIIPVLPTISIEMKPPTPLPKKFRNPTILYPKKYSKLNEYKPIPIPVRYEGDILEVPKAKPVKFVKPVLDVHDYEDAQEDEKKILKYQQAEEKRKFKEEEDARKQQEFVDASVAETYAAEPASEQETSETGFYGDSRDGYAAPLPAQAPVAEDAQGPAERTEFRMHGLQGPHSYKFGYDTGKGKNRQFRYEERNNDGHVKGHYGYVDHSGKTHVVNYDAHPEHGFHAEGPFGKV